MKRMIKNKVYSERDARKVANILYKAHQQNELRKITYGELKRESKLTHAKLIGAIRILENMTAIHPSWKSDRAVIKRGWFFAYNRNMSPIYSDNWPKQEVKEHTEPSAAPVKETNETDIRQSYVWAC